MSKIFKTNLVRISVATALVATMNSGVRAQDAQKFVPVLPKVKARMMHIDKAKGYSVTKIKPNVYVIADGGYQSMFVTTGQGVILFDAPPSFAQHIKSAVASVTKEPIRKLIYSHSHVDHTAGAVWLKDIPDLEIIAEQEVADYLRQMKDPRRLLPTKTFVDHTEIKFGTADIQLKKMRYHSNEGDLFIYLPKQKVLMAIDIFPPGYVPFMNFDLTTNMHDYLQVFDKVLAYDFDVMVGGHLTSLGNRQDVVDDKNYMLDVYRTVKSNVNDPANKKRILAPIVQKYGTENESLISQKMIDAFVEQSYQQIKPRWINKLADVDVYGESHVKTMFIYVFWEDKL